MAQWYDWPNETSAGTVSKLFVQYPDAILNGAYAYGFILVIWMLSFVGSLVSGSKKALSVASFITLLFSVFFYRMVDVHPGVYFALLILTIIGLIGSKEEAY